MYACAEDVKLSPEHRKRSPVTWTVHLPRAVRTVFIYFFSELSQFMISSSLNSIESDGRGRCLTRMDLMKRSMEPRVPGLLGKMM